MADKKCPHCGLWSTNSAILCDCGYNFEKGLLERSIDTNDQAPRVSSLSLVSLFLGILGILTIPLALFEPPVEYIGITLAYISVQLSPLSCLFSLIAGIVALARREAWWPIALIGICLATLPLFYMGSLMLRSLFGN